MEVEKRRRDVNHQPGTTGEAARVLDDRGESVVGDGRDCAANPRYP